MLDPELELDEPDPELGGGKAEKPGDTGTFTGSSATGAKPNVGVVVKGTLPCKEEVLTWHDPRVIGTVA